MPEYYNPPAKVAEIGRRLTGRSDFYALQRQLFPGEYLFALGDRLVFKLAPCVTTPADFDDFYVQYRNGNLVSLDFYAVPASALAEGGLAVKDGRLVPSSLA